eukprot:5975646-Pleurochrysis_carterae.AAC.1
MTGKHQILACGTASLHSRCLFGRCNRCTRILASSFLLARCGWRRPLSVCGVWRTLLQALMRQGTGRACAVPRVRSLGHCLTRNTAILRRR